MFRRWWRTGREAVCLWIQRLEQDKSWTTKNQLSIHLLWNELRLEIFSEECSIFRQATACIRKFIVVPRQPMSKNLCNCSSLISNFCRRIKRPTYLTDTFVQSVDSLDRPRISEGESIGSEPNDVSMLSMQCNSRMMVLPLGYVPQSPPVRISSQPRAWIFIQTVPIFIAQHMSNDDQKQHKRPEPCK